MKTKPHKKPVLSDRKRIEFALNDMELLRMDEFDWGNNDCEECIRDCMKILKKWRDKK